MLSNILLQVVDVETSSSVVSKIVDSILEHGPIAAVFLAVSIFLVYLLNKREKQIQELNKYIRNNDKDNLETLNKLSTTLDKIMDKQKNSDNNVVTEIKNTKEIIVLKIENLSNKVDNVDDKIDKIK